MVANTSKLIRFPAEDRLRILKIFIQSHFVWEDGRSAPPAPLSYSPARSVAQMLFRRMLNSLTHVTRDEDRDVELRPLQFFRLMRRIFGYAWPHRRIVLLLGC